MCSGCGPMLTAINTISATRHAAPAPTTHGQWLFSLRTSRPMIAVTMLPRSGRPGISQRRAPTLDMAGLLRLVGGLVAAWPEVRPLRGRGRRRQRLVLADRLLVRL